MSLMCLRFVLFFSGVAGVEFKAVDFRRRARIFGFGMTKTWIGWRRRPFFSMAGAGAAWVSCFFARLRGGVSLGILCETTAAGAAARFLVFLFAVFAGAGGATATVCFLKLALTAGATGRAVGLARAAFFTGVAFFAEAAFFIPTGATLLGADFLALTAGAGICFTLTGACALRAALFLRAFFGGTDRGADFLTALALWLGRPDRGSFTALRAFAPTWAVFARRSGFGWVAGPVRPFVAVLPFRAARGASAATVRFVSFTRDLPLVARVARGGSIRAVALLGLPSAAPRGRGWVSGFSLRFDFFSLGFPCRAVFLRIYQITGRPQQPMGAPPVVPVHLILKKNPMGLFCAGDFATPRINHFPLLLAQPLNLSPLPAKADSRGSLAVSGTIFSIQA